MPALSRIPVVVGGAMALSLVIVFGQFGARAQERKGNDLKKKEQKAETADEESPEFELPAKLTAQGQAVLDRATAESLIAYGEQNELPEAIVTGVLMLHKNPIDTVRKVGDDKTETAENSEKKRLQLLLDDAAKMLPDDPLLVQLVARARERLDEKSKGLAGGLQSWDVTIQPGKYYQLNPSLRYQIQQEAVVDARVIRDVGGTSAPRLAITVLGGNMRKPVQVVGNQGVSCHWNASLYESGWFVRVHNLEKRPLLVKVTAY